MILQPPCLLHTSTPTSPSSVRRPSAPALLRKKPFLCRPASQRPLDLKKQPPHLASQDQPPPYGAPGLPVAPAASQPRQRLTPPRRNLSNHACPPRLPPPLAMPQPSPAAPTWRPLTSPLIREDCWRRPSSRLSNSRGRTRRSRERERGEKSYRSRRRRQGVKRWAQMVQTQALSHSPPSRSRTAMQARRPRLLLPPVTTTPRGETLLCAPTLTFGQQGHAPPRLPTPPEGAHLHLSPLLR
ncbi:hypothetical protein BRADI_5g05932v3 [Brachypodium distachyon]|uniref:Uncharacterized protein n=1 Tax=Brachypodium distachyon TaxID=15368 RepID=A0A2K2CFM1_BRADI|nr:hypothetical protein BRADI_5g05932v3 [Brachypodium distachyon]